MKHPAIEKLEKQALLDRIVKLETKVAELEVLATQVNNSPQVECTIEIDIDEIKRYQYGFDLAIESFENLVDVEKVIENLEKKNDK